MTERQFRQIIVAEWVLVALGTVAYLIALPRLPEPLRVYEEGRAAGPNSASDVALMVFVMVLLPFAVWNAIELYRFRPRARRWFTVLLLVGFLTVPLGGPYVDSGWSQPFYYANMFLAGIVFATIHWTPLASRFERSGSMAA